MAKLVFDTDVSLKSLTVPGARLGYVFHKLAEWLQRATLALFKLESLLALIET